MHFSYLVSVEWICNNYGYSIFRGKTHWRLYRYVAKYSLSLDKHITKYGSLPFLIETFEMMFISASRALASKLSVKRNITTLTKNATFTLLTTRYIFSC